MAGAESTDPVVPGSRAVPGTAIDYMLSRVREPLFMRIGELLGVEVFTGWLRVSRVTARAPWSKVRILCSVQQGPESAMPGCFVLTAEEVKRGLRAMGTHGLRALKVDGPAIESDWAPWIEKCSKAVWCKKTPALAKCLPCHSALTSLSLDGCLGNHWLFLSTLPASLRHLTLRALDLENASDLPNRTQLQSLRVQKPSVAAWVLPASLTALDLGTAPPHLSKLLGQRPLLRYVRLGKGTTLRLIHELLASMPGIQWLQVDVLATRPLPGPDGPDTSQLVPMQELGPLNELRELRVNTAQVLDRLLSMCDMPALYSVTCVEPCRSPVPESPVQNHDTLGRSGAGTGAAESPADPSLAQRNKRRARHLWAAAWDGGRRSVQWLQGFVGLRALSLAALDCVPLAALRGLSGLEELTLCQHEDCACTESALCGLDGLGGRLWCVDASPLAEAATLLGPGDLVEATRLTASLRVVVLTPERLALVYKESRDYEQIRASGLRIHVAARVRARCPDTWVRRTDPFARLFPFADPVPLP